MADGAGMLFGFPIAAYAQHKIIKAEENIRDGADPWCRNCDNSGAGGLLPPAPGTTHA